MKTFPSVVHSVLALVSVGTAAVGADHPQLKAFSPAEEGLERRVIVLPHKERDEEDAFEVELIAGKQMETDGVNQVRLGYVFEPHPLPGWGYTFYRVTGSGQAATTLMAVPDGAAKVNRFVPGSSLKIRYNSRLPIVVYAPPEVEIRYRIWSASDQTHTAEKG